MLNYPLTQYMFCAPDEGAAAVVMCRADIAHRYTSKPVYLRAVEVRTRTYGAYEVNTTFAPVDEVPAPTVYAAEAAFEKAGVAPDDVDVIQLQDTDAGAEIIHMAECGFCEHGDQEKLLADGATEIGGAMPVNTDGGLIANGEPIGASGLRQIHELVRQLRGEAGDRQVAGEPRVGFAQLYGAPGTAAATIVTLASRAALRLLDVELRRPPYRLCGRAGMPAELACRLAVIGRGHHVQKPNTGDVHRKVAPQKPAGQRPSPSRRCTASPAAHRTAAASHRRPSRPSKAFPAWA